MSDQVATKGIHIGMLAAAELWEMVNPASDFERFNGDPGAGAMGVVIEFRDLIRAEAEKFRLGQKANRS